MEELRRQREARGKGSFLSIMQPLYCPELDELINKRIDVLYSFQLDSGEKALHWCQGKVIKILTETTKPTVVVQWDPMPDVEGKEDPRTRHIKSCHNVSGIRMWRVHGGWILMLALLKIPTLRTVKEISDLELNHMSRAVTRNWTKQNHRRLKAIVIKYNMIINGLLFSK